MSPPSKAGTGVGKLKLAKIMTHILSMSTKLTEVLNRIDLMKKSMGVQSVKHDAVIVKLTQQETTFQATEASLVMLSHLYDEVLRIVKTQENITVELNKKAEKMVSVIPKRDTEIQDLKASLDSVEQYSRRTLKYMVSTREKMRTCWISLSA